MKKIAKQPGIRARWKALPPLVRRPLAIIVLLGIAAAVASVWVYAANICGVSEPKERISLTLDLIRTLSALIGGSGLIFIISIYYKHRETELAEGKALSERLQRATEKLEAKHEEEDKEGKRTLVPNSVVRIGAIDDLAQLTKEIPSTRWRVIDILLEHVRSNLRLARPPQRVDGVSVTNIGDLPDITSTEQTALNVIIDQYGKCSEEDLRSIDLSQTNLNGAVLRSAKLSKVNLRQSYLKKANLSGSDLSGAILSDVHLNDATLDAANLHGADLRRALLMGAISTEKVILSKAKLIQANLPEIWFVDADLSGAWLSGADLTRANLLQANLNGAVLYGTDLTSTDLTEANLTGAKLGQAILSRTILCGADLSDVTKLAQDQLNEAYFDEKTILPSTFKHNAKKLRKRDQRDGKSLKKNYVYDPQEDKDILQWNEDLSADSSAEGEKK